MAIFVEITKEDALKRGTPIRKRKLDLCNIAQPSQNHLSFS